MDLSPRSGILPVFVCCSLGRGLPNGSRWRKAARKQGLPFLLTIHYKCERLRNRKSVFSTKTPEMVLTPHAQR
jgi:hypothetical protein